VSSGQEIVCSGANFSNLEQFHSSKIRGAALTIRVISSTPPLHCSPSREMDSGLGMSVSRSHESSDAEKSTKKSTSALSEASSGSQENKADGPVAPLINSSDASHDQTTTPQSSPNRSRGESRSPRYRNDDSDTVYFLAHSYTPKEIYKRLCAGTAPVCLVTLGLRSERYFFSRFSSAYEYLT